MKKIGIFKITESFKITGRGCVAIGQILDGKVKPGSHAHIQIGENSVLCRIVGVDMGNADSQGNFFVGLLLKNNEIDLLNYVINEQIIDIIYSNEV